MVYLLYRNIQFFYSEIYKLFMVSAVDAIFRKVSIHDSKFSFSYFMVSLFIVYFLIYLEFNAYDRRKESKLMCF